MEQELGNIEGVQQPIFQVVASYWILKSPSTGFVFLIQKISSVSKHEGDKQAAVRPHLSKRPQVTWGELRIR